MEQNKLELVKTAEIEATKDTLTELLRNGAKKLISQAVEAELNEMLSMYPEKLEDGRKSVVRNGYLPSRTIQTGIGDVSIKVPKVRDRSGKGIKFNSSLLPPYLKRTNGRVDTMAIFERYFYWRVSRSSIGVIRRSCKRIV